MTVIARTQSKAWMMLAGLVGGIGAWAMDADAQGGQPEPGFWLTGLAPGMTYGSVTALNKDGSVAAGWSANLPAPGFTWTKAGGRNDFGLLQGMPKLTPAYGISDSGAVAGYMDDGTFKTSRAYRWTGSGALQDLGVLPGWPRSFAWGISGDGAVVVGHAEGGQLGQNGEAFRWTAAKGMQGLGHLTPQSGLSQALAVSRDGKVVVGTNRNEVLHTDGFVWTEATGMKALASLIGGSSGAEAVNADGSVIVGDSIGIDGPTHIVRWRDGVVEDLSIGLPLSSSWGLAVSDNGEVVGGTYNTGGSNDSTALVWTLATGAVDLVAHLAARGVAVPSNYKPEYVYAVSGDGLTFGGRAWNTTTGIREGFVAMVPGDSCKADCDASGTLDIDDFICFQTRFAISDPYADCDVSGELDIDDFICFQTFFAMGC